MTHVAHQTMVMQFILELARSLETSPQNCIKPFFSRSVALGILYL